MVSVDWALGKAQFEAAKKDAGAADGADLDSDLADLESGGYAVSFFVVRLASAKHGSRQAAGWWCGPAAEQLASS